MHDNHFLYIAMWLNSSSHFNSLNFRTYHFNDTIIIVSPPFIQYATGQYFGIHYVHKNLSY